MEYLFSHLSSASIGLSSVGIIIINAVLVVMVVTCMYTDGTQHKIFNVVTFPAMILGLVLNGIFGGWTGLAWAFGGWVVGMAIQWVPFMLGFAKAGDVKLLAAVGALKGWYFCLFGFLYGAVAFGLLMIPWLAKNRELGGAGTNIKNYLELSALTQRKQDMPSSTKRRYMPWGVGLGIGFLLALILEVALGQAFWIRILGG